MIRKMVALDRTMLFLAQYFFQLARRKARFAKEKNASARWAGTEQTLTRRKARFAKRNTIAS